MIPDIRRLPQSMVWIAPSLHYYSKQPEVEVVESVSLGILCIDSNLLLRGVVTHAGFSGMGVILTRCYLVEVGAQDGERSKSSRCSWIGVQDGVDSIWLERT